MPPIKLSQQPTISSHEKDKSELKAIGDGRRDYKSQDSRSAGGNNKKPLDKFKLGKLEALKFKMNLQTKNLKLLTEHNDIMSGVMMDEKHAGRVQGYRRENKAF